LKTGAASRLASLAVIPDPILAGQAAEPSLAVTAHHHQSPDECSPTVPTRTAKIPGDITARAAADERIQVMQDCQDRLRLLRDAYLQ
jgi:hypothetical protein